MTNVIASIDITCRNLAQTCSPHLDVYYIFVQKKTQLESNFYFDHRKLTASIYIFSKIKKISLEIIFWFSLESFLGYFPDGLSYWGNLIREICDIKERNKAGSGP